MTPQEGLRSLQASKMHESCASRTLAGKGLEQGRGMAAVRPQQGVTPAAALAQSAGRALEGPCPPCPARTAKQ